MTLDEVVEEHRLAIGADSVHMSFGPNADPEKVRIYQEKHRKKVEKYNSFSDLDKERAKVARLKSCLRSVYKAHQMPFDEMLHYDWKNETYKRIRDSIQRNCDMIPEIDIEVDTNWLENNSR